MAQDTKVLPEQLMNSMLGKLFDILTMGDDGVMRSNNDFFSWASPGIAYDEDQFDFLVQGLTAMVRRPGQEREIDEETGEPKPLTEEQRAQLKEELGQQTAELYMEAENLAYLVDMIPSVVGLGEGKRPQNIWNPQGKVSYAYEKMLRMSQVISGELDEKTKAKIEKLRGLLVTKKTKIDLITDEEIEVTEPSVIEQRYFEKMQAYEEAVIDLNAVRIPAMTGSSQEAVHQWGLNAKALKNRVRAAWNDWISNGYKNDYERITAYISQVMGRDLTLLKESYKADLEDAKLTGIASGSDFYYTGLLPGNFAQAKGWTRFTFANTDYESHYDSTKKAWGARASYFGIGGGGVSGRSVEINRDIDWSSFRLSFEMVQVPIMRPWFHPEFLTSTYWRFSPKDIETGKADMLSDGKMPPSGDLPAYPTSAIFIRNLWLNFNASKSTKSYLNEVIRGGGGLSIGPFNVGGYYGKSSKNVDSEYSFDHQGIQVPGMQLVGFRCHLLPQAPNPVEKVKEDSWV